MKNSIKFKIRSKSISKKIKYIYVYCKLIKNWLTVYVDYIFSSLVLAFLLSLALYSYSNKKNKKCIKQGY